MASVAMTVGPAGSSSDPQISVSVVTYNNAHCLPGFLDSLRQQTEVRWELFVFDNASRDETPALIRKAGLGELFVSNANIGYGRGHNYNVARCRGPHLLFLNPDLEFCPDLFAALLRYLNEHLDHVLAGPCILEGPARRPFPPRHFYPGEGMIALEPGLRRPSIAWLNGCCFIVRRDVFEKLGGFDPDYFLYQDETDLCLRVRRAGYQIGHADKSAVYHLHRQSQRELSEYEYARRIFQGSTTFWGKHYPPNDVLRMVRFQYWISRMLLGLDLLRRWLPDLPAVLNEARLRARNDICREWLETHGYRRVGFGGVPGKIVLRQCRLVVEWIVQRRFPLDDY
jgi:GT2 family glycosyltransferase